MAEKVDVQVFKDQIKEKKLDKVTEKKITKLLGNAKTVTQKEAKILQSIIDDAIKAIKMVDDDIIKLQLQANINPFTTTVANEKLIEFTDNIEKMFNYGIRFSNKTPSSVVRLLQESVKQSTLTYITKMGDDYKTKAGDIISNGLRKKLQPSEISSQLQSQLNITRARANTIARTETMRAAHAGSYAQARRDGKQYFIIDSRAEACKYCISAYKGKVFGIDESIRLPPLHPNCACIPVYFDSLDEAERWSGMISKEIDQQISKLESEGKTINPDGTGAEVNKKKPEERIHN